MSTTLENPHAGGRWRWLPEIFKVAQLRYQSQVRLLGLSVLVGIVAGLAAAAFYVTTVVIEHYALISLVGYDPVPHPAGEVPLKWLPAVDPGTPFRPWLLLVVPTLGGLFTGLLVYTLAPEAEGHGTDNVIDAYHRRQGLIRPRVPLIKIVASAATIGTGGSGGREGPIAQIGAGFGSYLATLLKLRPAERRVLMAAGMGAGIAAIFRAPLAGALFASEVLYRSPEFESEVIMPAALASVVSYSTFGSIFGWKPLFAIPDMGFDNPLELLPYLLVALWAVLLAALYTHSFYGLTRLFRRLPLVPHVKPAIGAFLTGALGLTLYYAFGQKVVVLGVLSFGYNSLQSACEARRDRHRLDVPGHRGGQNSDHGADDRQRRLGRRVRALNGDRRLRRRGAGNAACATTSSGRGRFLLRLTARLSAWPGFSPRPPRRRFPLW